MSISFKSFFSSLALTLIEMGRVSKRAAKIRASSEFDLARLKAGLESPRYGQTGVGSWSLDDIIGARNAQMLGYFSEASRLADSMRTDDAIAVASENRLAPQRCIGVKIESAKPGNAKADSIAAEADALFGPSGIGVQPDTMTSIHSCLVDHGVAFGLVTSTPREDGSRVDMSLAYWPIKFVRWDAPKRCFVTRVDPANGAALVDITHGDGQWVVFSRHAYEPWKHGAVLLAACLVWARHAYAMRDWARGSASHGNAKVVGEMPSGVSLQGADGQLTPEAATFLELLRSIASGDSQAGIRPAGSKTEVLANNSTAWQVWDALAQNAEKAAARIYLGTDGVLGSNGGAPGVDIESLFGVAATIVQGDLECLERGILQGVIEPWCAVNFGDSKLAPKRVYMIPDSDADAERESVAKRRQAFFSDIRSAKDNGFRIDADFVARVAGDYAIEPPSLVEAGAAPPPSFELAPTDLARVVTVNEARATKGLHPIVLPDGQPDPDGNMTIEAYAAKRAAALNPPNPTTPTQNA